MVTYSFTFTESECQTLLSALSNASSEFMGLVVKTKGNAIKQDFYKQRQEASDQLNTKLSNLIFEQMQEKKNET